MSSRWLRRSYQMAMDVVCFNIHTKSLRYIRLNPRAWLSDGLLIQSTRRAALSWKIRLTEYLHLPTRSSVTSPIVAANFRKAPAGRRVVGPADFDHAQNFGFVSALAVIGASPATYLKNFGCRSTPLAKAQPRSEPSTILISVLEILMDSPSMPLCFDSTPLDRCPRRVSRH
jgi:hypothetical protein